MVASRSIGAEYDPTPGGTGRYDELGSRTVEISLKSVPLAGMEDRRTIQGEFRY